MMRGLSTEFVAEDEEFEGSLRIIKRARLVGLAVVDQPAYPASLVSHRQRVLDAKTFDITQYEGGRGRIVW